MTLAPASIAEPYSFNLQKQGISRAAFTIFVAQCIVLTALTFSIIVRSHTLLLAIASMSILTLATWIIPLLVIYAVEISLELTFFCVIRLMIIAAPFVRSS